MSASLLQALELSKSVGSRTSNTRRHEFLVNLAAAWGDIVSQGRKGCGGQGFSDFCSAIFGYVGWTTTGLSRAIDKALNDKRLV